jgi:hypothetical protein
VCDERVLRELVEETEPGPDDLGLDLTSTRFVVVYGLTEGESARVGIERVVL